MVLVNCSVNLYISFFGSQIITAPLYSGKNCVLFQFGLFSLLEISSEHMLFCTIFTLKSSSQTRDGCSAVGVRVLGEGAISCIQYDFPCNQSSGMRELLFNISFVLMLLGGVESYIAHPCTSGH